MRQRAPLLPLLALLCALPAAASEPYLVKDIDPIFQDGSSSPGGFARFGKYALFAATTVFEGREIWASDGTFTGTSLLVDSCPGTCSGDPHFLALTPRGYFFTTHDGRNLWVTRGTAASTIHLTEADESVLDETAVWMESQGLLYFYWRGSNGFPHLYRTDGTPAGTVPLAEVLPGLSGLKESAILGGRLFFSAQDRVAGGTLWVTDGTPAGTRIVKDTAPDNPSFSSEGPRFLHTLGRFLLFQAPGPLGWELWRSDGTPQGTRIVVDLVPGPNWPSIHSAIAVGKLFYMAAEADAEGLELWVSNGTRAGTRKLTKFSRDSPFAFRPIRFTPFGDRLIFLADDGAHGVEPWVTDGTPKGTRLLADVCPGSCTSFPFPWFVHQNRLFFAAMDSRSRGQELWVTDGTAAGTRIVRDICRKSCNSFPQDFTAFGNRLLFRAEDGRSGQEIWTTDGTATGTVRVSDLEPNSFKNGLEGVDVSGRFFFTAQDSAHGEELWITDGTRAGTRLLADLDDADHGGSFPGNLMTAGGTLFFFADDGLHGAELWKSDGSAEGTSLVHELSPGPDPAPGHNNLIRYEEAGGKLFFKLSTISTESLLWRTDGTDAGTFRLSSDDTEGVNDLQAVGDKVFFTATDDLSHQRLWVSDGTSSGTRPIPGTDVLAPHELTAFQGKLFFTAANPLLPEPARVVWSSDGTEAGTVPVANLARNPNQLTLHQGFLYFFAEDFEHGRELWRSDGTAAGTVLAADLRPGPASSEPNNLAPMTSLGSRLLLWNMTPGGNESGLWLYASDGTASGTRRLRRVSNNSSPVWGTVVLNGVAYFPGRDGSTEALWRTDGTEAGTFPLRDRDGHVIPPPRSLVASAGRLYFITEVPTALWQSDGTSAGTFPIRDLVVTGPEHSLSLAAVGPRVFFSSFHPGTGTELWAIDTRED